MNGRDDIKEIFDVGCSLGIHVSILNKREGTAVIEKIRSIGPDINFFNHISIFEGKHYPLEDLEFEYSNKLANNNGYLILDQEKYKNKVILFQNVQDVCKVMAECYGLEYLIVTNEFELFIAINWYGLKWFDVNNNMPNW